MSLWLPHIPVWEVIVRSLVVFFTLVLMVRLSGKRDVGEMSPADLILLLLLSSNVHTSLSGEDKSILGGLIGAAALILANRLLGFLSYRSPRFEGVLRGRPELVVIDGKPCEEVLRKHQLSRSQLKEALRKEGVNAFGSVRLAVLEPDGSVSVIKNKDAA